MYCGKRIVSIGADAEGTKIKIGKSVPYPYTFSKNVINNFLRKYARATKIYAHQNSIKPGNVVQYLTQLFQNDQIAWEAAKKSIKRIHKSRRTAAEGPWDRISSEKGYTHTPNQLLFDIDDPQVPFTSGNDI